MNMQITDQNAGPAPHQQHALPHAAETTIARSLRDAETLRTTLTYAHSAASPVASLLLLPLIADATRICSALSALKAAMESS